MNQVDWALPQASYPGMTVLSDGSKTAVQSLRDCTQLCNVEEECKKQDCVEDGRNSTQDKAKCL